MQSKKYRVAVIGATGKGDYGHGIDVAWLGVDNVELVAVADADISGRAKAAQRLSVKNAYADYREMLAREKPDFASVCPRHLDQRAEMVIAAAEAGCHIYTEKPFAPDLEAADRMVRAVQAAGIKLQIAHQMRCSPFLLKAVAMVRNGEIGDIQEIRGRGKEDHRAGGEALRRRTGDRGAAGRVAGRRPADALREVDRLVRRRRRRQVGAAVDVAAALDVDQRVDRRVARSRRRRDEARRRSAACHCRRRGGVRRRRGALAAHPRRGP